MNHSFPGTAESGFAQLEFKPRFYAESRKINPKVLLLLLVNTAMTNVSVQVCCFCAIIEKDNVL